MKCEYCEKDLGNIKNKNAHLRYCKKYQEFIKNCDSLLTKEYLIEHYIKNGESIAFISKELGLAKTRLVKKKLKEHEIKERTLQEAKKQKHHVEIAKQTSKKRYGYEFHVKSPEIIKKKEKTNLKKYGTKNLLKLETFINKAKKTCLKNYGSVNPFGSDIIKEKIKQTNLNKYGSENVFGNKDINKKAKETRLKNGTFIPFVSKKSQTLFWLIYNKLDKKDKQHCYFHELNKEFGKWDGDNYYFYDFVLTNKNKCIEFNGNYYHMNPELYEANNFNKRVGLTAEEIWKKDLIKIKYLESIGYSILVIWEKEFNDNKDILVEKIIKFLYE